MDTFTRYETMLVSASWRNHEPGYLYILQSLVSLDPDLKKENLYISRNKKI